ncbi:13191_t:CDS:2 [Gigaspora rosea]|nr:13191_t:CDS:2 [Gigaspora rosea]
MKETHTWILQQIKKATFEATPRVIFTDADPALIAAIWDEFPTTHALHLQQSSFIAIFEYKWKCLLEKYSNENVITGMFSTSRVESYNAKIKRLIFNSNMTLLELAEKLLVCILEEDKKTEYALFRASIPKTALSATADTILPNVCKMLGKYLTAELLKIQEDQIKQALHNSTEEPFLVAQKFEIEQSITMGWNGPVPYFNVLVNEVRDVNHKVINEQKLYEKAWGKARAALMVAVLRNDYKFITIFDKYINDRQEPLSDSDIDLSDSSNEDEIEIDNESLDPSELMNPHKRKGKGRPKGTNRIRCASEPSKKTKHKLHCKICGGAGHNQITCSQRQK